MKTPHEDLVNQLRAAVQVDRLQETAIALIDIPSPTRSAKPAADRLAEILVEDGFEVTRPDAEWPQSPAVVARFRTSKPGHTIHFHGHLDTVHLPFVPPRISNGMLYGSGAADMKGGIAGMCEAMRVLRDTALLPSGGVLLTTVDLHEAPWGDASQLKALIDTGQLGDAVLVPEYLRNCLPVMGRGMAILQVLITRDGVPVHEVQGGIDQPSVIGAGADLVGKLEQLNGQLRQHIHPMGDRESLFIGQLSSGEIYNQSPIEFRLAGTRRWLPGTDVSAVEAQFHQVLAALDHHDRISVDGQFQLVCDAFEMDHAEPFLDAFQAAHCAVSGCELPLGSKPFLDDCNHFISRAAVPAITHGPDAFGAHTLQEEVAVSELERIALQYALTAIMFCTPPTP